IGKAWRAGESRPAADFTGDHGYCGRANADGRDHRPGRCGPVAMAVESTIAAAVRAGAAGSPARDHGFACRNRPGFRHYRGRGTGVGLILSWLLRAVRTCPVPRRVAVATPVMVAAPIAVAAAIVVAIAATMIAIAVIAAVPAVRRTVVIEVVGTVEIRVGTGVIRIVIARPVIIVSAVISVAVVTASVAVVLIGTTRKRDKRRGAGQKREFAHLNSFRRPSSGFVWNETLEPVYSMRVAKLWPTFCASG